MIFRAEERRQMPTLPMEPGRKEGDSGGPGKPDVKRPDTSDLLKRMKRVDPDAARRYRQRSGE
jgi:hypothetical protein